MDFVTHLPWTSWRHDAVWVIVDRLIKSAHFLSHPDSRSGPIGGSEPSSESETIYWDSLPDFFFF